MRPSSYAPHCALQTTVLLVASLKYPRKFGFQKHKSLKPAIASAIFSRFQAKSLILWRNDDLLLQQRCDLLLVSGEGGVDHVVHVVVLVSAEAAAEHGVRLGLGLGLVLGVQCLVRIRVDRVVRLVATLGETAVFLPHHGLVRVLGIVALRVEVLEFDGAGVGYVRVGEVHHRAAEVVALIVADFLEVDRAPLEVAELIVEVTVHRARVHDGHASRLQHLLVVRLGLVEEVDSKLHSDARVVDHLLHPRGVAVGGQALPRVLEVAVVVVEAHGQALDDVGRQLGRVGLPLLAGVVLDERLIQGAADELDAFVVQVGRIGTGQLARLLFNQGLGFGRRVMRVEELVDGAQVDGQRVDLAVMGGVHAVHVIREARETVRVIPHALVGGVEQVGAVLVDLRTRLLVHVAVRVAADVVTDVDDVHAGTRMLHRLLRHRQAEQARTDNYQVGVFSRTHHAQ